jgi:hypothetical protein
MLTNRMTFIGALLRLVPFAVCGQAPPSAPLEVLFIGNSYTSANNLPAMLEGLADAAGGRKVHTDRHLVGGCTLERHVEEKKATEFDAWCQQQKAGLVGGLNGAYFDIAKQLEGRVAPVGVAWKMALAADPPFVLHRPDKSHPNPTGTYLAACVFFATLLDKSPVGLPGEVVQGGKVLVSVPGDEAKKLQETARAAAEANKAR